ncbi:DUF1700 domain-containing protein [Undibacterium sp. Di24W]|uniref:DUF1700 domain-containing protein n=1 Tax=Undibacterium sp. Di24W TaxID=3413033 RepID=UPI003BF13AA5
MNKTEYINTLRQELQGLPASVIDATLASYEKKFQDGISLGLSETEISQKLANPRLVAAQQRANARFQNLKRNLGPGNIFGFFIALIGLVIFNFFMLVPAILYGVFLFCAYLFSMALYLSATVMIAASLSGVPAMEFKLPGYHYSHSAAQVTRSLRHSHVGSVSVDISEAGIQVNKDKTDKLVHLPEANEDVVFHTDNRLGKIHIKNRMETRHFFFGIGMLIGATGLLLLCLWLTRLSVIGFGKYLLWTVSLLRGPVRSETTILA